jgi:membrane protein YqaA with SNARE-associated domain
MNYWLDRLHTWNLHLAKSKWGMWLLLIFTFADASIFPFPAQTYFLLIILLNTQKFARLIILGTLGTLTGALAGYLIGHYVLLDLNGEFTGPGQFLISHIPGYSQSAYNNIHLLYSKWHFGILFLGSFTPIPYGVFSISSGLFGVNLLIFCFAALISHVLKYFILAFVTIKLDREVKRIFKFNLLPFALAALVCILIAIVIIKVS